MDFPIHRSHTMFANELLATNYSYTSASVNTKGAWAEIQTLVLPCSGFFLHLDWFDYSGTSRHDILYDIGIGAAGSEVVLIANVFNEHSSTHPRGCHNTVFVPIALPAGTRVSFRLQSNVTGGTARPAWVAISPVYGEPEFPTLACCETLCANTADSGGLSVDASASAWTYGAWAELAASGFTRDVHYLWVALGMAGAAASTGWTRVQIAVGASGSEVIVFDSQWVGVLTGTKAATGFAHRPQIMEAPVTIRAGERLSARVAQEVTTTNRARDFILYGFS